MDLTDRAGLSTYMPWLNLYAGSSRDEAVHGHCFQGLAQLTRRQGAGAKGSREGASPATGLARRRTPQRRR